MKGFIRPNKQMKDLGFKIVIKQTLDSKMEEISMALFGKQICEHCGGPAGAMTRTKLADGKYICFDCGAKCPAFITNNFMNTWTYKDFKDYLEFRELNKKRLETFEITDVYFDKIFVDMNKGWMVFSRSDNYFYDRKTMLEENPDIFDMRGLIYYDFFYNIKDVKEGIFSTKVKADVRLIIAFKNRWYPYSFNAKVLRNHRHKAEIEGFIKRRAVFTENEMKSDLEIYLLSALLNNGVNIPVDIGNKLTMNYDFTPYDEYLKKVFELKKLDVYKDDEFESVLENITPSSVLRHKLKGIYK